MIRALGAFFAYACVATVLALSTAAGYAWYSGMLSTTKMLRMFAIVHDVELPDAGEESLRQEQQDRQWPLSYEDIEAMRDIKSRDIEIKLQAIKRGLDQLTYERQQLTQDKEKYVLLQQSFEQRLKELQEETETQGHANVRVILENVQPKKAKEIILKMVEADEMQDVVHMLSEMPTDKRAKIVSQFTSDEEKEVLDRILRLIRKGGAVSSLIDETREKVLQQ